MWQRWPIPAQHTHTQFVLCYNLIELKLKLVPSSKLILKPVQCSASQLSTRYIFYARYQLSQKDQHWIFTLDNVFWSIDITHTTRSAEKQCDVPRMIPEFSKTIFEVDFATETVLPTWVVCRLITKSAQISAVGLLIIVFLSRPMLKTLLYSNAILQDIVQYCAEVQYCRIFCTVAQWCKAQPCSRIRCIQEFAL